MKNILALAVVAVIIGLCPNAQAADDWDDMSWWGNTEGTVEPHPDATRSGYWWWPKEPESNVGDTQVWGNRGVVYHAWDKPKPAPKESPRRERPPAPPKVEQPKVKRNVIVLNNVLFDFDKATLKAEGKTEIDKLISELKAHAKDTVAIEAHTCNVGADSYNLALGQRRADAVKAYMVEMGIATARIDTVSYGETRPAVSNDTADNRKKNRRAEFKITLDN